MTSLFVLLKGLSVRTNPHFIDLNPFQYHFFFLTGRKIKAGNIPTGMTKHLNPLCMPKNDNCQL